MERMQRQKRPVVLPLHAADAPKQEAHLLNGVGLRGLAGAAAAGSQGSAMR